MRFGDIFLHVSAAIFAGALTIYAMQGESPPAPSASRKIDSVTIAPPRAGDLPAARGPKSLLAARLKAAGFASGDPLFIRVVKDERVLEVWLKRGNSFALFDAYPICYFSGALGPKLREGDGQAPEGFYEIGLKQLNPSSAYHLAFNLGYPNAYDRANGRTGALLMVHGNCVSIGCYAMTDYGITEIYTLMEAALRAGQRSVSVHIFPFRMSDAAMEEAAAYEPIDFWRELKPGYDSFEASHVPPAVFVCDRHYALEGGAACDRVASW